MLRNHRYKDHDTPKDPDIECWFQALGAPPVAHEPPGARAKFWLVSSNSHVKRARPGCLWQAQPTRWRCRQPCCSRSAQMFGGEDTSLGRVYKEPLRLP
jgi:hypothetical protein